MRYYDEAVKLQFKSAELYNAIGHSRYMLGELDAAEIAFQEVINMKQDFTEARYNLLLNEIRASITENRSSRKEIIDLITAFGKNDVPPQIALYTGVLYHLSG